jgi:hypothetical protein
MLTHSPRPRRFSPAVGRFITILFLLALGELPGQAQPAPARAATIAGNTIQSSAVTAIAAARLYTCALTNVGGVKCWGHNMFGEIGDGTTTDRSTPVDVSGLSSGVTAIAAGDQYTCALTSVGGVKCWGWNNHGQLGDGTTTYRLMPVDVVGLSSGVTAIAAGVWHTCALTSVGGVKCWGYNYAGQLGDGTTIDRWTPVDVVGLDGSPPAACAGGANHSTIEALPASVPADGTAAATITVTLCNSAGEPMTGKTVLLSSDRGEDLIEQPTAPTDANGQTSGFVRSFVAGIASIEAVDMTDYIQVPQPASVQFAALTVPPNAELRSAIDALDQQTRGQLGLLAGSAQTSGQLGDTFRGKLASDTAKSAVDVLAGPIHELLPANDTAIKLGVELDLPGVISTGWGTIKSLKEHYESAGNMFNRNEREPLLTQTWSVLTRPTLISGLEYIVNPKDKVEDVTLDILESGLDLFVKSTGGSSAAGNRISQDIGDVQKELANQHQALIAGIPLMDSAQQHTYALDLNARRGVAMALVSAQYRQALYLNNLQHARESLNPGDYEFFLKFGAKTLAKAMFDGVGEAIVGGTTTLFDFYRHSNQVTLDQQGYALALANLNGAVATTRSIYANTSTGYQRIAQQKPPQPVTGQIGTIRHYSVGSANWIGFWNERSSYSDIEITNTGDSTAAFEVIVEYGYNSRAFTMPIAYVPLVDNKIIQVGAGQTATVRIPYKQEEYGGSPDKNDHVYFYVLGVNDTGMFYVGYKDAPWNPQRVESASLLSTSPRTVPKAVLTTETPTIENPINTYILSDPSAQTYQAQIWINNPFTGTITANITQALPSGMNIVATDDASNGSTITWSKTIAASGVTSATVTFRYAAAPGAPVSIPPATLAFVEPGSGQVLTTQSNTASFNTVWPVTVQGSAPLGRYGVLMTMPVTVTNLLAQNVSGDITVVISDTANAALYSDTQPFMTTGLAQRAVAFTLPVGLPIGLYPLEIRLSVDGATRSVIRDVYQVRGHQVFLPMVARRN